MDGTYARVRSWLVVDAGFSKRNAEIAIQQFIQGGILTPNEAQLIGQAMKLVPNPQTMRGMEPKPWEIHPAIGPERAKVLNALNFRISKEFGNDRK